eukprot:2401693-Rhodomonas_salina.1
MRSKRQSEISAAASSLPRSRASGPCHEWSRGAGSVVTRARHGHESWSREHGTSHEDGGHEVIAQIT